MGRRGTVPEDAVHLSARVWFVGSCEPRDEVEGVARRGAAANRSRWARGMFQSAEPMNAPTKSIMTRPSEVEAVA